MIRKAIESVIPGGPFVVAGVESIFKHPFRTATVGLLGFAALGAWQGHFETSVEVKTEVTAEDLGRGEIVAIDLEIPEHPIVGFTADVVGAKTVLNKEFNATILGVDLPSIPAGTNWVTLADTVPTVISHNPNSITAAYDPGMLSDEDDDRIILTVPLDGFSVSNHIEPDREDYDFHGNWQNLGGNFASAFARSFDGLKDLPGIGTIDDANNATEQTLLGITRVSILNNVAETCTPNVTSNAVVYEAMHKNIANLAPLALRDSTDPQIQKLKDTKTATQIENMEIVVRIGAETDKQPFLPNQTLNFQNPYTDKMEEYAQNPDIQFEAEGTFECELSDEVKAMVGETKATPSATPSATSESK